MNVGLIKLPNSALSTLRAMQSREEAVQGLLDQEDRYCGEVLTS